MYRQKMEEIIKGRKKDFENRVSKIGRWKSLQHCGLVKSDCLCILGAMAIAGMADVGRGWMPCENQTREQLRAVSPVTGTMP